MSRRQKSQLRWGVLLCAAALVAAFAIWHAPEPAPVAANPDGYGGKGKKEKHEEPEHDPVPHYDLGAIDKGYDRKSCLTE